MKPDLARLRRFALTVALVLIATAVAGVHVREDFNVLGVGLRVARPDLIPLALVLASIYAALRFWFYAFVAQESPMRARRRLIDLYRRGESRVEPEDRYKVVEQLLEFVPERGTSLNFIGRSVQGENLGYKVEFDISWWAERLWSRVMDIDYTAPIWANVLAILLAVAFGR